MNKIIFFLAALLVVNGVIGQNITLKKDTLQKTKAVKKNNSDNIRYYYYPNLEAYFDLKHRVYIYKVNGVWIQKQAIPANYRGYSMYNKRYVILSDVHVSNDKPYLLINQHKKKYPPNFKGRFIKNKEKKNK
jgi:hypothetical protein